MEARPSRKRKLPLADDSASKRSKAARKWRLRSEQLDRRTSPSGIEPGVSGIWVTCERGREAGCVSQLYELFNEYATNIYGSAKADALQDDQVLASIEADIESELRGLRQPDQKPLFQSIKMDMKCVLFFQTRPPVEPTTLVRRICEDARDLKSVARVRHVKRLTPVTRTARATENGLNELAMAVLPHHFHEAGGRSKRFAIRTAFRSHNSLKRDDVIKRIADAVGKQHQVDLEHPHLQILVEISQNVCSMAVVDDSYMALRRYNLAELYS